MYVRSVRTYLSSSSSANQKSKGGHRGVATGRLEISLDDPGFADAVDKCWEKENMADGRGPALFRPEPSARRATMVFRCSRR